MMEPTTVTIIVVLLALVFLFLGVPIAAALALPGLLGIGLLRGSFVAGFGLGAFEAISTLSNYAMTVVPMFILMGELASLTGISRDLFDAAYKVVGRLPGGLAVATCFAAAGFASVTGSSVSSCMALARIAAPQMKKYNYRDDLITGVIATSGTLAILIPPSISAVVYAVFAQQIEQG